MTSTSPLSPAAGRGPPVKAAAASFDAPWRALAFVGVFALALITLRPFADLGAADAADLSSGRDAITYFVYAAASIGLLALVGASDGASLRALRRPAFVALAIWLAVTCVLSPDPVTSAKRAALCAMTAILAATAPLLPRGKTHLALLLAAAAGAVIGLSYFGVLALPRYAIHQVSDVVEPGLAGDWRGVFGHKNDAAPVFGMLAFVGLYVMRRGPAVVGAALTALALVFVVAADGKTAMLIWPPTLLLSLLAPRFAPTRWWPLLALAPLLALNAVGVGALLFAPLAKLAQSLPIDSTFTGRSDVWRFGLEQFWTKWLTGYGFAAFWNNPTIRYAMESGWVGAAAHAHNGYLDAALSGGLVGLGLTLWALVAQPLADARAAARGGADPALMTMAVQIWLYGVTASTLESFFFDRANPVWFLFLFGTFLLRYCASFRAADG